MTDDDADYTPLARRVLAAARFVASHRAHVPDDHEIDPAADWWTIHQRPTLEIAAHRFIDRAQEGLDESDPGRVEAFVYSEMAEAGLTRHVNINLGNLDADELQAWMLIHDSLARIHRVMGDVDEYWRHADVARGLLDERARRDAAATKFAEGRVQ